MSDNFYLTLPSNSSMEYFPENSLTSFTTKLPRRIELMERYEMCLTELHYPHTWYNLTPQTGGKLKIKNKEPTVLRKEFIFTKKYSHPRSFLKDLQANLVKDETIAQRLEIFANTFSVRQPQSGTQVNHMQTSISVNPRYFELWLPLEIATELGFSSLQLNHLLGKKMINTESFVRITEPVLASDQSTIPKIEINRSFIYYVQLFNAGNEEFHIPPAYYSNPQLLTNYLNVNVEVRFGYKRDEQKHRRCVFFDFSPMTERMSVTVSSPYSLHLTENLAGLLGFENKIDFEPGEWEAPSSHDFRFGFYSIFVYCDIIEPSPVGDTFAPLLRLIQVDGKHGDLISKSFNTLYYRPVSRTSFDTVSIYLRNDTGLPIPFQQGRVTATLHFRTIR